MTHFMGKEILSSWIPISSLWSIGLLSLASEANGPLLTYSAQLWYFGAYYDSEYLWDQNFYASLD